MQTHAFLRALAPLASLVLLAACSPREPGPYEAIQDAPVVQARLHTVTLVSTDSGVAERLKRDGYSEAPPAPNYPGSLRVLPALWKVPEEVAAKPSIFMAPAGRGPNVRILETPPPEKAPSAVDGKVLEAFYRNVLGSAVPRWPERGELPASARIHAWTFLVDDIVATRDRLRTAGIPITFNAVGITTAYLGDHKLLGLTAPDGVIVELVQTAAH